MTRIESEKETMVTMVVLYCRGNHDDPSPCHRCTDLIFYANGRLDACPFGELRDHVGDAAFIVMMMSIVYSCPRS